MYQLIPKVSLVMPVWNQERYLAKAISSVLSQTYPDFQLIVWDDGSTDNSLSIARSFVTTDSRIKIHAAIHQGVSKSVSNAIALHATGKYIGWVDSDDWLHPQALQLLVPVLDSRIDLGVVYSDYMAVDTQGTELEVSRSAKIPYSKERLLLDLMSHHFRLIRRSIYEEVGGIDTDFKFNYDYDLCLRLSEIASFYYFPQVLYYRRMHPDSITSRHRKEQISYSKLAAERAIARRGLDKNLKVIVCPDTGKVQLQIK